MRRALAATLLAGTLVALAQGHAGASTSPDLAALPPIFVEATAALGFLGQDSSSEENARCGEFFYVQTYRGWGPARYYERSVTVEYRASRCASPRGTTLDVAMDGTATIHEGDSASGSVIDTRPFTVVGTSEDPTNPLGWPPEWWQCTVPFAEYLWQIEGIYSFGVAAAGGTWSLEVSVAAHPQSDLGWTFDACA